MASHKKHGRTKYSPIGLNKDGARMAPPPAKLSQGRKMTESPQMSKPEPYEVGRKNKTRS